MLTPTGRLRRIDQHAPPRMAASRWWRRASASVAPSAPPTALAAAVDLTRQMQSKHRHPTERLAGRGNGPQLQSLGLRYRPHASQMPVVADQVLWK